MTISFSYAYLNGLLRLIVRGRPTSPSFLSDARSLPVVMAVHRSNRAMSPRRTAEKLLSGGRKREKTRRAIHENRLRHVVGVVPRNDVVDGEEMGTSIQSLSAKDATVRA